MKWVSFPIILGFLMFYFQASAQVEIKANIAPNHDILPWQLSSKDVAELIPVGMVATEDISFVFKQIADYNIEQKLKTEFFLPPQNKQEVGQRFIFKYAAFQNIAKFEYTGRFKASLNCNTTLPQADISLSEKIWNNKDITISHSIISKDSFNTVGLGWAW